MPPFRAVEMDRWVNACYTSMKTWAQTPAPRKKSLEAQTKSQQ